MSSAENDPSVLPEFSVILGADYAGESTVLSTLSREGWRCISYDEHLLPGEHTLISQLRDSIMPTALRQSGSVYSPDFVLTVLQSSVVYLRDQVLRAPPDEAVVVDSFYYKILAKCRLTGMVNEGLFRWWRSFPRPSQIIYLDVDPAVAWSRSGEGTLLNSFEYYGSRPTWENFRHFQLDLRKAVLEETRGVPVTVLEQQVATADAVRTILRSSDNTIRVG